MQFEGALVLVPERAIFGQQLDRHFKDGGYGEDGLTINGHGGLNERAGFYQLPKRCTAPTDTVARFCVGLRSRGMRTLIATLGVFLAMATPAGAVQLVNPDGSVAQPYQSWADSSRVPTVAGHISVVINPTICGAHRACTSAGHESTPPTIWLTNPSLVPINLYTTMHELGHQYDFAMPEWKRIVFQRIVQLPTTPWYVARPHVAKSLSEVFADAYAECAIVRRAEAIVLALEDGDFHEIPARSVRRVCRLIRQPN